MPTLNERLQAQGIRENGKLQREKDQARANASGNEVRRKGDQVIEVKSDKNIQREATGNVNSDIRGGEAFGKRILGDGLSRISDNADSKLVKKRLLDSANGNDKQRNLRRSQGLNALSGQAQSSQRSLTSSLSRSGVKGGTAAAAQLEQNALTANSRRTFEENSAIADQATQDRALQQFSTFTQANAQFDIGQEQKEKAIELQASLGFTNLLGTERNSIRQEQAANLLAFQEKSSGGGGTSFLCTHLRSKGLMSNKESLDMFSIMIKAVILKPRFLFWYLNNMKPVVDSLNMSIEALYALKRVSVNAVLEEKKCKGIVAASDMYIDVIANIAISHNIEVPSNLKTGSLLSVVRYLPKIIVLKSTRSYIIKYSRIKIGRISKSFQVFRSI